jgi:predicted AlkP superfamily phosphohydrolase/phosphomutase
LWDACYDESHEYHYQFLHYFKELDRAIGEIVDDIEEEDQLIILSDHGMEEIKINVNINAYLLQEGFLVFGDGEGYKKIGKGTKAFSLDPGRIYINREGMYPSGSVRKEEEQDIIESLIFTLEDMKWNGERVVDKVYRREDIYQGRYVKYAPDLVLMSNRGFNIKGNISNENIFEEKNLFSGKHTYQDAFLYVKNNDLVPHKPTLEDVRVIIEQYES